MALDNKTLVRRYIEGVFGKQHNLSIMDEILSSDFIEYQNDGSNGELAIRGHEEWKKIANVYLSAFPDMQCKILEQIADGDKVVCLWTAQATHKGTFMGVAPTNKRVTVTGISIFLIVNGKIVEGRTNWDLMGLLTQLGVLPTLLKKVA